MENGYDVSGVYQIKPKGAPDLDNVYCEILNDTAYTVIQRRTEFTQYAQKEVNCYW
jgi:hypothetical protein